MPKAFRTIVRFHAWLARNHGSVKELTIRLFKVHAKHKGIGYREALDESLCWGWIDGVRHAYDADSFTQRFTPRKPKSYWSKVNIKRFRELDAEGRIAPPGRAAFKPGNTHPAKYSYEADLALSPAIEKAFRADKVAWAYFSARPPGYQRICRRMIMSAVREETRVRRLAMVMDYSRKGKPIPILDRSKA